MEQQGCRILVAEDDDFSRVVLGDILAGLGYEVTLACNGRQALELCRQEQFPVVITDRIMPVMDGLELCRAIRELPSEHYVFILLLTSMDKRDELIAGLEAGADEYLIKPVHEVELAARLKVARRILGLEMSLRQLALHDQLTGAFNRGYLDRQLAKELQRCRRYSHPLSVILCDIDHFKDVNDRFGHAAGDQVLKELVTRVNRSIRSENDWLARYGGEEFVIVLPETPASGCEAAAERFRELFAAHPVSAAGRSIPLTVSFGGITVDGDAFPEVLTVETLLAGADACLYRAKEAGRDRVVCTRL